MTQLEIGAIFKVDHANVIGANRNDAFSNGATFLTEFFTTHRFEEKI